MVSKNQIKLITSLNQKKFRNEHQLFIAEGKKVIDEFLDANYKLHSLYVTVSDLFTVSKDKMTLISETDLKKISVLKTPNLALALFEIPKNKNDKSNGVTVVLDDIRDPGNLGTIIRLCDWFGITQLVCSLNTADVYNPKVIQATMGSISRVEVVYCDLVNYLKTSNLPIFGTFMDGSSIYKEKLPKEGIIIMGNEANGISVEIEALVANRISIPRFGTQQKTESLNVATATSIVLSEWFRNS